MEINDVTSTPELLRAWNDLRGSDTQYVALNSGTPLPVQVSPSPGSRTLIILFHGAMNREKRPYPSYLKARKEFLSQAHQISLADTSLGEHGDLTNGWFIGSEKTPLQTLVPAFLSSIIEGLGIEKVVFVGGSSGGFAALYYSWQFAGSAAVVAVPQTNVNSYYTKRRDQLLESCWGSEWSEREDLPCLDLRELYGQGAKNSVVYLQSELDPFHLASQMSPFTASLPSEVWERFVLRCSYWGVSGHSGSVPPYIWDSWVRAVIAAPELTAESIITTHQLLQGSSASPTRAAAKSDSSAVSDRDLQLAARLAKDLIGKD